MTKINMKLNGNVIIEYNDESYKSVIQNLEEDCFCISVPVRDHEYLTLDTGEVLEMFYYIDGSSYFKYKAEILERVIEGNIPMYKLSEPYNIEKIQRRDFVRVSLVERVFYRKEYVEDKKWEKGFLLDLSGGGLRIKISEETELDDTLLVNIFVGEEKISVLGKVIRLEKTPEKEYICGLEFIDIEERKRDKIVGKVFAQMRKQRELL